MDRFVLLAIGVLIALVPVSFWYDRWCQRNGVARSSTGTGGDSIFGSDGDGGGD